ncbi:PTS sugar transporter subunit IIC [Demequina pelophila]|uniref:PTS sugar transporter subunit IIC n=1 Tax=Demequina pelophila TaxID=1638984 RepID=UPI001D0E9DEC|nr:PTS transporter subunit EIIC [Demequina pelophila]
MTKVNTNVWVVSVRDSIMQILPFILVGSVFVMLAILNDYFPSLPSFWTPFGWTMGLISLFVSFLVPFNLMEKKRLRKQRLIAGLTGLSLFLVIITPQVIADGEVGFGHSALGAGGMFVALFSGLFTGLVMSLFGKFTFFKEDSAIPEFVRAWFDAMIPIGLIVATGWVVVDIVGFDLYNMVLGVFMPLAGVIETPWGFTLLMMLYVFLYSMGISSWVLTPVAHPVMLAAITANMAGDAENLVTSATVYSAYLWVGGIGCTMPLVIMLMRSRAKRLKALGRASAVPAVFNINEPVVFGAIAWNPMLMVPMWLQGLILPPLVWFFTKTVHFAPIPMRQFEMWYAPFPLATWLTTGAITGILLMALIVAVATAIWFPFFRAYERQVVEQETAELAAKEGKKAAEAARREAADTIQVATPA